MLLRGRNAIVSETDVTGGGVNGSVRIPENMVE